jgi:hypothetical protein
MSSQNIQSYIVHKVPAFSLIPIVFNDEPVSEECCNYKNKFGEYVCNKSKIEGKFCIDHNLILTIFKQTANKLIQIGNNYKNQLHSLDSFMKLFYNMINYFFVNREYFVNFSNDQSIYRLNNIIIQKLIQLRTSLINYTYNSNNISNNLKILKNSLPLNYHINKLAELQDKINDTIINVQINKARESLISNNIKLFKLSEIQLKTTHETNKSCVIITKDIKDKILSFIQ